METSGVKQQSWLLRTDWWWSEGKNVIPNKMVCDSEKTLWDHELGLILWKRTAKKSTWWKWMNEEKTIVCLLALYALCLTFCCRTRHSGHWPKRSRLTAKFQDFPMQKRILCSTVKYQFRARRALCAWQQWQLIYLYPEKERAMIYLIMLSERSTGIHSSLLVVHNEIVDFLLI